MEVPGRRSYEVTHTPGCLQSYITVLLWDISLLYVWCVLQFEYFGWYILWMEAKTTFKSLLASSVIVHTPFLSVTRFRGHIGGILTLR